MRQFIITAILTASCALAVAGHGDALLEKARRAYDNGEWASATALYGVVCDRTPGITEAYARRIVASELITDTIGSVAAIEEAMNAEVSAQELFRELRGNAFASGHAGIYPSVLTRARNKLPWMARPIDTALLEYYKFRNNPAETESYARTLLAGLPDDTGYLSTLAGSYMMQGEESEAVAIYRHILEIDPANFDALVILGNYSLDTGNKTQAREYLARAYAIRPTPALRKTLDNIGSVKREGQGINL